MAYFFDEDYAQSLWRDGKIDDCIIYAMGCIPVRLAGAHRRLAKQTQWDDLEAEYQVYLVQAVQRYNPTKGCKLFTWISNYLRFAELNFVRKESQYYLVNVQL